MGAKDQHPQEKGIVTFFCFVFSSRQTEAELCVAIVLICTGTFFQMLQAVQLYCLSLLMSGWHDMKICFSLGLSEDL